MLQARTSALPSLYEQLVWANEGYKAKPAQHSAAHTTGPKILRHLAKPAVKKATLRDIETALGLEPKTVYFRVRQLILNDYLQRTAKADLGRGLNANSEVEITDAGRRYLATCR